MLNSSHDQLRALIYQQLIKSLDAYTDTALLAVVALVLPPTDSYKNLRQKVLKKIEASRKQELSKPAFNIDTFALAVVNAAVNSKKVTGSQLVAITRLLLQHEVQPGGPYKNNKGEVELLLNLFIALFLQQQDVLLLPLNEYIKNSLRDLAGKKEFFLSFQKEIYLASLLSSTQTSLLLKYTTASQSVAALVLSAHLKASGSAEHEFANLIKANKYLIFNTNDPLTLAALSALEQHSPHSRFANTHAYDSFQESVYEMVQNSNLQARASLSVRLQQSTAVIRQADQNQEISLLTYYFLKAVRGKLSKLEIQKSLILGAANVFCWIAYTIYDDFLDQEGNANYLSAANIAMRESLNLYFQVASDELTCSRVRYLYQAMDEANAWELEHTRCKVTSKQIIISALPEYDDLSILSRRAGGHVAGIFVIAASLRFSDSDMQFLQAGLHHYLVARQLNDDIHDWAKDLRSGHCSYVVTKLLKGVKINKGSYAHQQLHDHLQAYFWQKGFLEISTDILNEVAAAKNAFKKITRLNQTADFWKYLNAIEYSANASRKLYKEKNDFLSAYKDFEIAG